MKITYLPPGPAIGYENSAIVKDGFFVERITSVAARRVYKRMTKSISKESAAKMGGAHSLNEVIEANRGQSKNDK